LQKISSCDFVWQNWQVWVKSRISTVRDLRAILVGMAYDLQLVPEQRGLYILVDSKFTKARLESELQAFKEIVDDKLAEGIYLALFERDKGFVYFPEQQCNIPLNELKPLIQQEQSSIGISSPGATRIAILNLLILQWLSQGEPQTTEGLSIASGASYPTVFNTIKQLEAENLITRQTDRRVSLKRFPVNLWKRWVVESEARKSVRFRDISGQPRTPEDMAERLKKLHLQNVAIGGVFGARYYYPKLDITGSPRLDLVVHGGINSDLEFIKKLDPALSPIVNVVEPANVVVHFLSRAEAMFIKDSNGFVLADPIECLANLYQGGLDYQADDMLSKLIIKCEEEKEC
jgi:hypothetical protein